MWTLQSQLQFDGFSVGQNLKKCQNLAIFPQNKNCAKAFEFDNLEVTCSLYYVINDEKNI